MIMKKNKNDVFRDNPITQRRGKYYLRKNTLFACIALIVVILCTGAKLFIPLKNENNEMTEAYIVRIIDGDTMVVAMNQNEEVVRLIGVDSPESVSLEESENSIYGDYASVYTGNCLEKGQKVYLTFDEQLRDPYDRLLAYLWIEPDISDVTNLYQYQMVRDGYAIAVTYEPNERYSLNLKEAMQYAIQERKGLWVHRDYYKEHIN